MALALGGCRRAAPPPVPDNGAASGARVVLARTDAGPDLPPVVVGDSLLFRVVYPGGCRDHAFRLAPERRGDTLALRLVDDDADDACEGSVYDELRLPLPAAVRRHDGPLTLVDPSGEAFSLR